MVISTPIFLVASILLLGPVPARGTARRHKAFPYPLKCAGIAVGPVDEDPKVVKRFGRGSFAKDEGHGGGRYYADPNHRVLLHVEIGPDGTIESLEYGRGIHVPKGLRTPAASPRLKTTELIGKDIHLDDRSGSILAKLGRPGRDQRNGSTRVIKYQTDYKHYREVLFYEAKFRFVKDRLVYVSVYNGE